MRSVKSRRAEFAVVAFIVAASCFVSRLGLWLGRAYVAPGPGYPRAPLLARDLFRFDAEYYFDIATSGYAYGGNPNSSPNVVFAPGFPLVVKLVPWLDPVTAGFVVNFVLFACGVFLLRRVLAHEFGPRVAFFALLAQVTCAGSYAFHAYYSESLMLAALAGALYARQRGRTTWLAVAGAVLGASRLTALPVVALIAGDLLWRTWRGHLSLVRGLTLAALSAGGAAGYLTYVGVVFGAPWKLLPEIQAASWGLFHPPTAWWKVITGAYLAEHFGAAMTHPIDVRTLNLAWTIAALASAVVLLRRKSRGWFAAVFALYVGFVYALGASSEWLISAHRFYALMSPIFVVGALTCARLPTIAARAVGVTMLVFNAGLAVWHTACFNQGVWFYF